MASMIYPAHVRQSGDGLTAEFIDFADLKVHAGSIPGLLRTARHALSEKLRALEAADAEWPAPSGIDVALEGAVPVVWIDIDVEDAPVRVTISVGERLLKQIDEAAGARGMTRSGFIAVACRSLLPSTVGSGTGGFGDEVSGIGRKVEEALGPDSTIGRALADLDARMRDGFRHVAAEVREAFRPVPDDEAS